MICNVANCAYTATSDIESFPVCSLHDCEHVKAMLNRLERPGAFSAQDKPIIIPVGPLLEEHFEPQEGDGTDPETCPRLAAINFDCHSNVLPKFDLTKEYRA